MPVAQDDRESEQIVVLIVDDHPDIADLITEYLRFHGVLPLCAESADEARSVLESEVRVDVVVTDYAMPGEDGLSLLARIRTMPRREGLPVVVVSGHDMSGEVASAARSLGAEFVRKPFELETLVRTVKEAINSARASAKGTRQHE